MEYQSDFYDQRNIRTEHAAATVLGLIRRLVPVRSAVDVGCGVGTWLKALDVPVRGIDGPWVDRKHLVIPEDRFTQHDFGTGFELEIPEHFDLAISLEVGEHIAPQQTDAYVAFLCRLSDVVLFSAAVPDQGGLGHRNENWPPYWVDRFAAQGYIVKDVIRSRIWEDEGIPWWYRQNIMLFGKPEAIGHIEERAYDLHAMPLVHPKMFGSHVHLYTHQAWDKLVKCIKAALARRFTRRGELNAV
jgi:hypothetical protein